MLGCVMLSTFAFSLTIYYSIASPLLFGNCCNSSIREDMGLNTVFFVIPYPSGRITQRTSELILNNHLFDSCFGLLGES